MLFYHFLQTFMAFRFPVIPLHSSRSLSWCGSSARFCLTFQQLDGTAVCERLTTAACINQACRHLEEDGVGGPRSRNLYPVQSVAPTAPRGGEEATLALTRISSRFVKRGVLNGIVAEVSKT